MKKTEVKPGAIAVLLNSHFTGYDNRDRDGRIRRFKLTGRTLRKFCNTYIEGVEINTGEVRWIMAGRLKLEEKAND